MKREFSVLMSVYYKEDPSFLKSSLDSLINQTLMPSEIVLVEDGPLTAELYDVIEEFSNSNPNFKRVPLTENQGLGKALNEGLKHCSYNLVARMDSDDISCPDRFEKQMSIFAKYPQVEVVSCWIDEFEGKPENIIATRKVPEYPYQITKYAKTRSPINHASAVFRKDSILFAGGYQSFPLMEDYYLWVRLLMNGAHFYNIQESLLLVRTSADMYKRRGGLKHATTEFKFQNLIRKLGFISFPCFLYNVTIRFTTRIIPNKLREFIYKRFLR